MVAAAVFPPVRLCWVGGLKLCSHRFPRLRSVVCSRCYVGLDYVHLFEKQGVLLVCVPVSTVRAAARCVDSRTRGLQRESLMKHLSILREQNPCKFYRPCA